jgi:hypothetical protein
MSTALSPFRLEDGLILRDNRTFPLHFDEDREDSCKRLHLDASPSSSLDWSASIEAGKKWEGLLYWELDLGIPEQLTAPLDDTAQFRTLELAVKHFSKELWPLFAERSVGVNLFSGSLEGLSDVVYSHELEEGFLESRAPAEDPLTQRALFARDVLADFLQLLLPSLPADAIPFVEFDLHGVHDRYLALRLLEDEAWEHFSVQRRAGWSTAAPGEENVGLVLPAPDFQAALSSVEWERVYSTIESSGRLIQERDITIRWHGLDALIVFSRTVSPLGKRMLQGFCAAGGTVVSVGDSLGLSHECTWETWSGQ